MWFLSVGVFAQELWFDLGSGEHFGKNCIVPVQLMVYPQGQKISTTDVMLQSSMKYINFVPSTWTFPYFFPPIQRSNGIVHVVGFTVLPEQLVTQDGMIGTAYFQANDQDTGAYIHYYFEWEGKTTDSNLWYVGKDYLKRVGSAQFIIDQSPCAHAAAAVSGVDTTALLNGTLQDINKDYSAFRLHIFLTRDLPLLILALLLVILIVLAIIYRKNVSLFIKQKFAWKGAVA